MDMASVVINNHYTAVLNTFGKDLQTSINTALQKYLIDLITSGLSKKACLELNFFPGKRPRKE